MRGTVIHPPSKEEGLNDIGYIMRTVLGNKISIDTRKSILEGQQWLRFHVWFIIRLYYKMKQMLL